eukprot:517105-Amphidinium_carterae.1
MTRLVTVLLAAAFEWITGGCFSRNLPDDEIETVESPCAFADLLTRTVGPNWTYCTAYAFKATKFEKGRAEHYANEGMEDIVLFTLCILAIMSTKPGRNTSAAAYQTARVRALNQNSRTGCSKHGVHSTGEEIRTGTHSRFDSCNQSISVSACNLLGLHLAAPQ